MLHVSWDPVLIGISFVVAFIASFIALDSAGKVAISSKRESTFWRRYAGYGDLVDAFYRYAGHENDYADQLSPITHRVFVLYCAHFCNPRHQYRYFR